MEFQNYVKALFANQDFETSPNAFELPSKTKAEIMSFIVEKSVYAELTLDQQIEMIGAKQVIFRKNVGGQFKRKQGFIDLVKEIKKMTFPSVVLNWKQPFFVLEGYTASDALLGLPEVGPLKLEKFANQFAHSFEREAFKELEKEIEATTTTFADTFQQKYEFDFINSKPEEIYDFLINLATKLTMYQNEKEGIDLIDRNKIRITVSPYLLDKVARVGLVGNRAETSYVGGQYSTGTIGGYKILANPFLSDYSVIIGTTFSCGGQAQLVAAEMQKAVGQDKYIYFEAMAVFGSIYKETIIGVKHKAKPVAEITGAPASG